MQQAPHPSARPMISARRALDAAIASVACASVCALAFVGCGSTQAGAPPVIDALEMPASVAPSADGSYHATGTISWHDDDDGVHTVHLDVPSFHLGYDVSAGDQAHVLHAPLLLEFAATAKGTVEIDVTLIDAAGIKSEPMKKTVVLQ